MMSDKEPAFSAACGTGEAEGEGGEEQGAVPREGGGDGTVC